MFRQKHRRQSSEPRTRFDTKSAIHNRKRKKRIIINWTSSKLNFLFWALQHMKREAANHIYAKGLLQRIYWLLK